MSIPLARSAVALFAGLGVLAATPAAATVCGSHATMAKFLAEHYEESARGAGLVSDRSLVELFTSAKGTWTILITGAEGQSCLLAAGHTWREHEPKLAGPEA